MAQKLALEDAAKRVQDRFAESQGIALEFGLGNGRTYDHIREILPDRDIYVFDRQVAAHPDCIPPDDRLYLGDLFETLPQATRDHAGDAVFAHLDIGTGDQESSMALVDRALPLILKLMRPGAVLVSDQPVTHPDLTPLPLPNGIKPGRIHMAEVS